MLKQYVGVSFKVKVPVGVTVTKKSPVEDFIIYSFYEQGRLGAVLYVGNHPDTELLNKDGKVGYTKSGLIYHYAYNEDMIISEAVFRTHNSWPEYLHISLCSMLFKDSFLIILDQVEIANHRT